jgi:hypothetical protein
MNRREFARLVGTGVAGALNGSYALPTKRTGKWAFENTWLVYSRVAIVILGYGNTLPTQ